MGACALKSVLLAWIVSALFASLQSYCPTQAARHQLHSSFCISSRALRWPTKIESANREETAMWAPVRQGHTSGFSVRYDCSAQQISTFTHYFAQNLKRVVIIGRHFLNAARPLSASSVVHSPSCSAILAFLGCLPAISSAPARV